MKKLILIALMAAVPASAFAATPADVIGSIFNFILSNIDKNANGTVNTNKKVLLKANGGNLILGRLYFKKVANNDSVNFPNCGAKSANQRVDRVRLRVAEANVYVGSVKLTYNNGTSANVNVNSTFAKGSTSSWVNVGANRCIRTIKASGQAQGGNANAISAVTFVGHMSNP